ncbi:bacillithiol biosynthesis cysteine-adding enzyme BshC [Robiginitalea aurantiaca]|uniref:Putative cysteine ligase BshC n=1 Tax=Robiginitalea aurantiaca TaxID=3056915 RepID=A0ABT7WI78_9FLAO|nr:bacillithiol biosynthesis cysteine-adding enzyme BshC [Robiginitalea aurantiaca]MDM9632625.1 bacillithiol biosynthesis cysteine-adding enzyme BshC [Robiginitalea aurantiaca]
MQSQGIPFQDTGFFSNLIEDYLDQRDDLQPFYGRFPSLNAFKAQIEEKQSNFPKEHRAVVSEVLSEQYSGLQASVKTLGHIKALQDQKTFTVVTGHQLNLFTGPLYFVYKILSAVKLAQQLKEAYPDCHFVPVYWMASEDHDFEEINHFNFRGKEVRWNRGASGGVGRLDLEGLQAVFETFSADLGPGKRSDTLRNMFQSAYLEHSNLASATQYLANELFGHLGLVVLDADDARLKRLFTPHIENDLFKNLGYTTVGKSIEKLNALPGNYRIQVSPREINFFYLIEGLRNRLVAEGDGFSVVDSKIRFSETELREELRDHPERFSPNVTTRPLYQEVILPNLCYIGGGGELAYWLELKGFFEASDVPFPLLLLRNSALLMSRKQGQKLQKLNLTTADLFLDPDRLVEKRVREISELSIDFSPQKEHLIKQFKGLYDIASKTDKSFLGAVQAQEVKQLKGLERLEKRLLKAQKRKLNDEVSRVRDLQDALFPGGSLQERSRNFSEFYLDFGPELFQDLLEAFQPLDQEFSVFIF